MDETLRTRRGEAERHNSALREAEAANRKKTSGLDHVLEAKQGLWQRVEQERARVAEGAKQRKQREIEALMRQLQQEEQSAFSKLDDEERRMGHEAISLVEINW